MAARITGILLGLAALILAAFCVAQRLELRAIRAEIAMLKAPAAAAARVDVASAATTVSARTPANAAGRTGVRAKKIRIKKRAHSEMAELMKDPKRKKFMEAVWTLHMDTVYGPLFRYYEMTDEELRYFQSLLTEKMSCAEDFGVRLMEADAQEAADVRKQQEQAEAGLDGRIREFLGSEAYGEFENYEERIPDRAMLMDFRDILSVSDSPLSADQEDELVGIVYEERRNLPLLRQLTQSGGGQALLESVPPDRVRQEFEEGSSRMVLRARQVLTHDQFELFTNYVGQLRDMVEVGLAVQSAAEPAEDGRGTQK